MKNVLILGGLGFIGGYLSRKCVELGYNVTILSRSDSKIENIKEIRDSVKLIIKDVKDIGEEVKDQDIIFHLAGSTDNYAIIDGEPYKDIDMNCNSTIALLEACKNYSPKANNIIEKDMVLFTITDPNSLNKLEKYLLASITYLVMTFSCL